MQGLSLYPILKFGAMIGFVICSVLVISLNYSVFKRIFKERTNSMWWLFLSITVIPFVVMIGIFTILFDRSSNVDRLILIKDGKIALVSTEPDSLNLIVSKPQDLLYKYFHSGKQK